MLFYGEKIFIFQREYFFFIVEELKLFHSRFRTLTLLLIDYSINRKQEIDKHIVLYKRLLTSHQYSREFKYCWCRKRDDFVEVNGPNSHLLSNKSRAFFRPGIVWPG